MNLTMDQDASAFRMGGRMIVAGGKEPMYLNLTPFLVVVTFVRNPRVSRYDPSLISSHRVNSGAHIR